MNEKVCMLTSVHTVWDTRIYHREARSLARAGYEVTLIATGVDSQKATPGVAIVGLKRPRRRIGRALNWLPFIRAALRTKADIYHFHDPDLLFVGFLLKSLTGKPIIYDNHDPYVDAIRQREWLPRPLRPAVARIFGSVEQLVAARLSAVIIANDGQQARFPHAALVRNYPDIESFEDSQSDRKIGPPQIMHVGTLTEARGAFELVEIASRLAHREVTLRCMGPFANESMASDIARTVERLNLQHVIRFEGRAAHEQVIQGLMEASAGLIPFRAVPNHLIIIPTKLFEYMMCAVPVVASDLPPIRRYVTEVDCGLLVPPENPAAFAEAVEYLLDHPEEAQRMGRNGRQAVLSRYNWAAEEQKLLSLYKELLG